MMASGKKRLQEIQHELDKPYDIQGDLQEQFIAKKLLISEARFIGSRMIRSKYRRKFALELVAPIVLALAALFSLAFFVLMGAA